MPFLQCTSQLHNLPQSPLCCEFCSKWSRLLVSKSVRTPELSDAVSSSSKIISFFTVHGVCYAQAVCHLPPLPLLPYMLLSCCQCQRAKDFLRRGKKERAGWHFSRGFVCPPLLLGVCHHRFKFPFKFLHTVGVQKYGLLVNAALCTGTGIF